MTPIEWTGWLISGTLGLLLVIQFEATRHLAVPRPSRRTRWPSLSILIDGTVRTETVAESVRSIAELDYPGEVEIFASVAAGSEIERLLEVAHPAIRRFTPADSKENPLPDDQLAESVTGDYLLLTSGDLIHAPESARAIVSYAEESEADLVLLTHRPELRSASQLLLAPLEHFLFLTFPSRSAEDAPSHGGSYPHIRARLVRHESWNRLDSRARSSTDDGGMIVELADGRFLLEHRAHSSSEELFIEIERSLPRVAIGSRIHSVGFAAILLALFVLPPVAAVVTQSFAWLMATVLGLFLRLRTAARSGEPILLVLLHPLAVAVLAVDILRRPRARSRNEHD